MRRTQFYWTAAGRCPVQEHLDTLPDKTVRKIAWVLRAVRDLERVPANYLKKLVNTDDIWEIRVDVGKVYNAHAKMDSVEIRGKRLA